jgi:hypothetical protein
LNTSMRWLLSVHSPPISILACTGLRSLPKAVVGIEPSLLHERAERILSRWSGLAQPVLSNFKDCNSADGKA